jgi:Zn finger protein HypA/HybF involved in hydrogenase expression
MEDTQPNMNHDLMLDGNAVGGLLHELFAIDMTATPAECANCSTVSEMGSLMAFMQAPGTVLRCPACGQVMMSIVEMPNAMHLDIRGVAQLRIARSAGST